MRPGLLVGHGVVEAHAVFEGKEGQGAFASGVRQESPVETAPSQGSPVESAYITSNLTVVVSIQAFIRFYISLTSSLEAES